METRNKEYPELGKERAKFLGNSLALNPGHGYPEFDLRRIGVQDSIDWITPEILRGLVDAHPVMLIRELAALVLAKESSLSDTENARGYLTRLFQSVAPQCTPLDTFSGLATQIDNYIAGQAKTETWLRKIVVDWMAGGFTSPGASDVLHLAAWHFGLLEPPTDESQRKTGHLLPEAPKEGFAPIVPGKAKDDGTGRVSAYDKTWPEAPKEGA